MLKGSDLIHPRMIYEIRRELSYPLTKLLIRAWKLIQYQKFGNMLIFHPLTQRHIHTRSHFTALWILCWINRVSWYQKKCLPTYTYCGHQSSLICFIHLLRSMASSLFNPHTWQSFFNNLYPSFLWSTSWPAPGAAEGEEKWGVKAHGEHVEREPIMGVWGQSPQWGPAAERLVRESGEQSPPEAESFFVSGRYTQQPRETV